MRHLFRVRLFLPTHDLFHPLEGMSVRLVALIADALHHGREMLEVFKFGGHLIELGARMLLQILARLVNMLDRQLHEGGIARCRRHERRATRSVRRAWKVRLDACGRGLARPVVDDGFRPFGTSRALGGPPFGTLGVQARVKRHDGLGNPRCCPYIVRG